MKLSVIGCGYLGAVHAAAMASIGHEVVGIDVDETKIASLTAGRAPFFEPGLQEILKAGIASGRLRFTTDMAAATARPSTSSASARRSRRRATRPTSRMCTRRSTLSCRTCSPAISSRASRRSRRHGGTADRAHRADRGDARVESRVPPRGLGCARHDRPDRLVVGVPQGAEGSEPPRSSARSTTRPSRRRRPSS